MGSVATAMLCKEQGITITGVCAIYEIFVAQKVSLLIGGSLRGISEGEGGRRALGFVGKHNILFILDWEGSLFGRCSRSFAPEVTPDNEVLNNYKYPSRDVKMSSKSRKVVYEIYFTRF